MGNVYEAYSAHVSMSISHALIRQTVHVWQLFSSQFYMHLQWSSKLDQYLCSDANSYNPVTGDVVEACSVHVSMSISHAFTDTFHSFLALNSTCFCEVPNLISTFIVMLIVKILSFIDWWCGLSAREHEHFTCICGKRFTFYSFLALNSTHIVWWWRIWWGTNGTYPWRR